MPSADTTTHILLVEDEAFLRELVMEGLQDAGFNVLEASDGTTGVQALKSDQRIDVLLSDIKLPDIDGYQVAEAARTLRPGLKVILMTGYAPSPLPPTLQSVVYRVLQKPFSLETLPGMVNAALEA
ncbi:response regulator [Frateuria edaphi]|jgi:DNA-binding NtrC family response regulator|uniref:response regulator n=1 Tax=Frateuria TaxID=70411 RepID=UPI001E2F69E9|nr:response regulator [Frateuria edaphi]UGB46800.1 response regulator [Frateuria edaphi]